MLWDRAPGFQTERVYALRFSHGLKMHTGMTFVNTGLWEKKQSS